jgi:hypothetical protein
MLIGYHVPKSADFFAICVIVVMSSALRQLARRAAPQFAALRGGNAPAHGAKSSFNLSYDFSFYVASISLLTSVFERF